MILNIESSNTYLYDILNKNPNTDNGLYLTEHKNGVLLGNCVSKNKYDVVFFDTKNSYTSYEDNQIDFKSFCDARIILSIGNEFFKHLLKEKSDYENSVISWLGKTNKEIDSSLCIITVNNIWIDSNWVRNEEFILSRYMPNIKIFKKGYNLYELKIQGDSIFDAFNLLILCGFLIQLTNEESLFLNDDLIKKHARVLTNIKEAPYFVYYLFIKRVLIYKTKIWDELEPYLTNKIKENLNLDCIFTKNDTHSDRINFVKNNIDYNNTILDYGCGEFRYLKALAKNIKNKFISYDIDDYNELYQNIKKRYDDIDWVFTNDLEIIDKTQPLSVIISEVIEHNHLSVAKSMIEDLVNNHNIKQLIITTPNLSFNVYYNLNGELRREDHVVELTNEEFILFIKNLNIKPCSMAFHKISDIVNGESVTSAVNINFY